MNHESSSDILVADPHLSLVPYGEYEVMYHSHETRFVFGRKLIVHFTITETGMAGLRVSRFYSITSKHSEKNQGYVANLRWEVVAPFFGNT